MEQKFYVCKKCGYVVTNLKDSGVTETCCDEARVELVPNTTDAATEKHVPVVEATDEALSVVVGSTLHPMTPEHYIEWIMVETTEGFKVKYLTPDSEPKAEFALAEGETVTRVLAYCNLHGLWQI